MNSKFKTNAEVDIIPKTPPVSFEYRITSDFFGDMGGIDLLFDCSKN